MFVKDLEAAWSALLLCGLLGVLVLRGQGEANVVAEVGVALLNTLLLPVLQQRIYDIDY